MRRAPLLILTVVLVAACGDAGDPTVASSPLATGAADATTTPETATEPSGELATETPTDAATSPQGSGSGTGGDTGGTGSTGGTSDSGTVGDSDEGGGDVGSSGGQDATTGVDERWVTAAEQDLAAHLGVAVADIVVVEGGNVDWNDSSLGCPEPGRSYLQVITPGYRLLLGHGDQRYHYHGARDREPFRCERPAEGGYGSSSDM